MIFDTIKTNTTFIVTAKNLSASKVPDTGLGFLKYEQNSYAIFIDTKLYKIDIVDENKLNDIDLYCRNRKYTAIISIVEAKREKLFTLEIIFFAYPILEIFDPFYVSLDENYKKIDSTAKKYKLIKKYAKEEELSKALSKTVSFDINGESYFLTSTAIASQQEVFGENIKKLNEEIKRIGNNKKHSEEEKEEYIQEKLSKIKALEEEKKTLAFTIHGEQIHIPVEQESSNEDYNFIATKLVSFKKSEPKDTLRLVKGSIEFKSGLVSKKIANDLAGILEEEEEGYLNTWDKYINEEGKILIERAKKVGVLKIKKAERTNQGYNLRIENFKEIKEELNIDDHLSIADEVPSYIKEDYTWIEFIAQKEKEDSFNISKNKSQSFKIEKLTTEFIHIKTDKNIKNLESKNIVLSIFGDEIQLERKLKARKRLLEGKSANPHLGLLIEDTENFKKYLNTSQNKKLSPLTDKVKTKIFPKNEPTPNQIEAIDIALNTPDIAIIQGPPGTGKTTVLAAIMERLNEISDKENIRGQVLVAGFQHYAVENIIQRLSVNAMPTPKFGKKSTTTVDITSYERVMEWSDEIATHLKSSLPKLSNHKKISDLNNYFEAYLKVPSKTYALELLKMIVDDFGFLPKSEEILTDAKSILDSLKNETSTNITQLKYIYGLRTTELSFKDDGIVRNLDVLVSNIGKNLKPNEKQILKYNSITGLDTYLPKLQKLKYDLINQFYPKPVFRAEKPNAEIVKLKDKVQQHLSNGKSTKDRINSVLYNYINELEANPFGLKSMIEEYSYAYSSTTGHSSKAANEKGGYDNDVVVFDTVIIDEAARVAPMDLLLVMVLAKKRIILVGDHRQLPHVVEDKIIKSADLKENKFINESMFAYLKTRVKKFEIEDNIKREITLNNQFRMHPTLGKFVSDNFYKDYNEEFESPLPTENFFQDLTGIENTPAVWIDVPNNKKEDSAKRNQFGSWGRTLEAKKIVEYIKKWIFSEQGKELSFGVITFYGEQVRVLEDSFTEEETKEIGNRLKIGTVDSFQGMEFDIVLLSVVRSSDLKQQIKDNRPFGFLVSKNRLCVSMSRQKRSLIVVGDKTFYQTDRAISEVKELNNFIQLCEKEGKIL